MKKIIFSLAMIAAVAAVVVGATRAYFNDEEKSVGNTLTAGTIDIAIDSENPWTKNFDLGDMKPGETGHINFRINNVGENAANISKTLANIAGTGGIVAYNCDGRDVSSEPECVAERTTAKDDVQTQIIYDLAVEVYDANDTKIWWQTIYTDDEGKHLDDVYGATGGNSVALGMIPSKGYMLVTQSYHFDPEAGNEYQGDKLSFDITIRAEQLAQEYGYTTVAMENKVEGADHIWNIVQDGVEGTLSYKTKADKFDYELKAKVNTTGNYTLIYVGTTNDYPCVGSVVLGTADFTAGIESSLNGQVTTGDITNGKVWLIPSSSYSSSVMTAWPAADILFETALINFDQN